MRLFDTARTSMFPKPLPQLWKAFGNNQPTIISKVEKHLWRVLFDIVTTRTTVTIPGLVFEALTDISAMGIYDIRGLEASWFKAGEILLYPLRINLNLIT